MNNVQRITNCIKRVSKAEDKRRLASATRMWVQDTKKIHALNYWYYRFFTNEFELYILDAIQFVQTDEEAPSKGDQE